VRLISRANGIKFAWLNAKRTRSKSDIIFNLMILCGFLLPILAVPMGLVLFLISFQHHLELREALKVMARMILLMVVVGLILLNLGKYLLKRLKRRESA
jgi:uncharacterized membrane protein YphA (DoxX/SURF4 family)